MDLEGLRARQEAFEALIEADTVVTNNEFSRADDLEEAGLSDGELTDLSVALGEREIDIIERLLKMPTDGEVFHATEVSEAVDTEPDRCIQGRVWKTKVQEMVRNVDVPSLGTITVVKKHTRQFSKAGNGRVMDEQEHCDYEVRHANPRSDDENAAQTLKAEGAPGAWEVDVIASIEDTGRGSDDGRTPGVATSNVDLIARAAEQVDSLESIAAAVGVSIKVAEVETA